MPDASDADRAARWRDALPFGVGRVKPRHYRDMLRVVWENRDAPRYAWSVLRRGVCDGCALGVSGFRDWTIDGVHLCMTRLNLLRLNTMPALDPSRLADVAPLQQESNRALRDLGRLPYPMLRRRGDPGFVRVTWDEALGLIGERLTQTSAERMAFFLTSRGITNETYYVAQKAARLLGTNNVDNAARLCHSPSTGAMKRALGVAATTCSYRDWFTSDLIVFFGSNPANDQPVTTKYLHEAKRRGARVAMVNPYREPGMDRYWIPSVTSSALFGTDITDAWFDVAVGGDIAFCWGVLKTMIEAGWYDHQFVSTHTAGFDELADEAAKHSWEALEAASGLPRSEMVRFAELLRDAERAVLVWSMGITQHAFGGDAVQMIVNLALTKGYVGRDGCGLMPIRGHSGVQGGAEMGAYATAFPGGTPIDRPSAAALEQRWGFPVPTSPGLTGPEMIEAASRGELDVLYCLGANFLRTLPDPDHVAGALARVPLRVHQDIIVTDQMLLDPGDAVLLLPAKTRYEQDGGGTETTTERRILFTPELPRQVGEARAEWRILRDVAAAARPDAAAQFGCGSGQAIREEIAEVVPTYRGIEGLAQPGDQVQWGGPHLCANWEFPTPDGRAHLVPVPLPTARRSPEHFIVATRRGKQFNTLIYADVDPLTGAPRDAVFINPDDAAAHRLRGGDPVRLVGTDGRFDGHVFLAPIARGNLQIHWPEGNVLIPRGSVDALGGVPDYNAEVRLERPSP